MTLQTQWKVVEIHRIESPKEYTDTTNIGRVPTNNSPNSLLSLSPMGGELHVENKTTNTRQFFFFFYTWVPDETLSVFP